MKEDYVKYLEAIGITDALHERIEPMLNIFQEMCSDEIKDIFISDFIKEDGSREYEHLCFFSEKYFMDAKLFISQFKLTINPIKKRLFNLNIQKKDYDFKKANGKSRLTIEVDLNLGRLRIALRASKENCDYLHMLMKKYIVPNFIE